MCYVHGAFIQNVFSLTNSQPGSYKSEVMKLFTAVLNEIVLLTFVWRGHLNLARF